MDQSPNRVLAGVCGVALIGVLAFGLSQPSSPPIPVPDPTPIVRTPIADAAAVAVKAYAKSLSENAKATADKLAAGELTTPDAAYQWLQETNVAARKEAFRPWGVELDTAIAGGRLEAALRESASGFARGAK